MSGGNHIRYLGLLALIGALAIAAGIPARATGADPAAFSTGVATANIAWEKPAIIAATLGDIAEAGFTRVRIGLKNPLSGTYRALEEAKRADLEILVTIPLIDGAVAAKGAVPRPRTDGFFPSYGLSQIDLARYQARLEDFLAFADVHQIPLIGLELGNELNWSGYNGDLPLAARGHVIATEADWTPEQRALFAVGLDRYRAVIDITRTALAKNPALSKVKLISAGLADINSDFIVNSGATYVAPDLVYRAFDTRDLFDHVDVVGIHLYEPLRFANSLGARTDLIDSQLAPCGQNAFARRPCWLTEFGTALPQQECAPDDRRRIEIMQPLLEYLDTPGNAERVPQGFYYDWNDDAGFSLVRCGQPTALTRMLPRSNDGDGKDPGTP
ncbi:MAG: hypothetical protein IPK59_19755 [Rhodospirillaceae bacterium]|nr:hypothetical protein [Rhodospirillaceae bacterium]